MIHRNFINKTENNKNKNNKWIYKKTFLKRINQDLDKFIKSKKTE